jgi:simple sugar transport system substrate-binding protein
MSKKLLSILLVVGLVLAFVTPVVAAPKPVLYWISHGSPADPVWIYYLAGANQWAKDTGIDVRTSFHSGDVPSQQEAIRSAIAAKAKAIITTTPDPGSLNKVIADAHAAGIPVIIINTDDKASGRDAYVGNDLVDLGRRWAQYLVDKGYVKAGSFVWMPVEVPGASYGVLETKGIDGVFKPLGINYEVSGLNTLDQAEVISRMADYVTANRNKITAIITLGDLVTGSIKRVFDQVGVAAGAIPAVGWGNSLDTANEVLKGYVKAAMWADPQAMSYLGLSMGLMASSGIKPGFDLTLGSMYEANRAQYYATIMGGK